MSQSTGSISDKTSLIEFAQCEGASAYRHGFAGSQAGHSNADPLQTIVFYLAAGSRDNDFTDLAFDKLASLSCVFQVKGHGGQSAKSVTIGAEVQLWA
jgi:hypothetical protein